MTGDPSGYPTSHLGLGVRPSKDAWAPVRVTGEAGLGKVFEFGAVGVPKGTPAILNPVKFRLVG
jgi:hypothetical protein